MKYGDYLTPTERLRALNRPLIGLIFALAVIGFIVLYSAAGGAFFPWALPQMIRFMIGFGLMIGIASMDLQWWFKWAYVFYFISFVLLILVSVMGKVGMGAQRWLDLYIFKLQPSELVKISLVLALAAYFHRLNTDDIYKPQHLMVPLLLIAAPAVLVMKQPDLGTMLLLVMIGFSTLLMAGVRLYYFVGVGIATLAAIPIVWNVLLKDYQKNRVLTFLDPMTDPKGSGYHILQSKIAIGSGGFFGKGYFHGTQGYLNFLPEKQTDFIFTLFCEEFGFIGAVLLIFLYVCLLMQAFKIVLKNRSKFGQLLSFGIMITLFIYLGINMSMVMGLVPVVGVPLPMISYGGTSMLTLMMGFGLLLNADVNHRMKVSKY
jgi:rod shape determining protein RodA